ncbi:MAG: bifunctional demethylmenaquinone methyltransferase/2-methoxy-6-polyprenyl-1,4-benzoquinol methylase UbiE [Candidatus Marinimicrobia bacterium]|nr:bifunctional demethylmenaquinone methyltransferase/2-methoxy-6-polyprenyl-1,4-benzoquinol methylase UbiE [Candidatus Neomarinimicrobiota bacterium]
MENSPQDRIKLVDGVFTSIYKKYDLMNDVISLEFHRIIKRNAIKNCQSGNLLDLAAGTGDLAIYFRKLYGENNKITLADPNAEMLDYAKIRLEKKSINKNIEFVTCYAEDLPFKDKSFDNVTIGFGFRNFTDRVKALNEINRVLRNNGRLIIIDFSRPANLIINTLNTFYMNNIVPVLAKIITGNISEYRYLAKSIEEHPNQSKIIKIMETAGFTNCRYENKLNGIIAVHSGNK